MWLYTYLNSFDGIEKIYNAITPMRGARKTWDIRPLQKRSKWWERIIKIDDNTYALGDGWFSASYGDPDRTEEVKAEDLDRVLTLSPILWQRRADGDYIQIRSNVNRSASWSRYKFLDNFLPNKLRHEFDSSGVHWISYQGQKYVLPKGVRRYDFNPKTKQHGLIEREDRYLEFKHMGGDAYVLSHGGYTKSVPIVNREVTKKYNKKIRELWEYAKVILPVFGYTLEEQYAEKVKVVSATRWQGARSVEPATVRNILDDPEKYAEQRLAFCVLAAIEIESTEARYTTQTHGNHSWKTVDGRMFCEHEKSFDKFRKLVQKVGGMLTTKEVEI